MKKRKSTLTALLLASALAVTACGQGQELPDEPETAEAESEETYADWDGGEKIEKVSEEGKTWTVFKSSHTAMGLLIEDWNDTLAAQLMEEKTGIHLEFITPMLGEEDTQLSLLIASGNTPDFIMGGINGYAGGALGMLYDGVSVDLAEHLDQMPNFKHQLEMSEYRQKEVYSDEGKISGLPVFNDNDEESEVYVGILIRKDLLDEVGMDIPETYDEWHEVLTAFKEQCGITKPFSPGFSGFGQNNMWSTGYGFGFDDYWGDLCAFYQKDGQVRYAPVDDQESFKAYLEMMAQWYEEGLIDPDFQSVTDITTQISTYSSKDCGACVTAYSLAPVLAQIGSEFKEGYEYVAAPIPVLEKGQTIHEYAVTSKLALNSVIITNECDDLDLALKYWDQYYTQEASDITCWGLEGTTYELLEDGGKKWTSQMLEDPDYNFTNMRWAKVGGGYPGCFDMSSNRVSEFDMAADELYRSQGDSSYRISSNVTLTEEEREQFNTYMTDIKTYVDEMCIKYIIGQESFDNFDQFTEQIRKMGIQECKDVYQQALDRYNAR